MLPEWSNVGPPGIVQGQRGIGIMVDVQDIPAGAVIASTRGIYQSRRIMVLRPVSDFDRLELSPGFIERGPDRDAGIGHQAIHDLLPFLAVVGVGLCTAFDLLTAVVFEGFSLGERIAAGHVLPDDQAQLVASGVPACWLDLHVLANHVEPPSELFEPSQGADLFKRSGARYAFLTSNFHDGYCLWPSPFRPGWNSRDVGPNRDLLGDFSRAMRDAGLRAGFYCSLGEFDHPRYVKAQENGDLEPFVRAHMQPQLREAVNRYSPSFSSFLSRRARPPSTLLPVLREIEPIVGQTIQEFLEFYLH